VPEVLTEPQIVTQLAAHVGREHSDAVLGREVNLSWGSARIDLLALNGAVSGYEVKSARDSLARVRRQVAVYKQTLEFVTFVVDPIHLRGIRPLVPRWCGLVEVGSENGQASFVQRRKARRNPAADPREICFFLSRRDIQAELQRRGCRGLGRTPRHEMVAMLIGMASTEQLWALSREALSSRLRARSA
jgi:hypothetical protein